MISSFPTLKISLLIIVVVIIIAVICYKFATDSNVQKFIAFGTVSAAMGATIALIFVMQQANQLKESVRIQTNSFSIEQRPYIFAELRDISFGKASEDGMFYGVGNIYLENKGKVPADIIVEETDYIIASDENGKIDNEKWFDEYAGGYPHVKVVFPDQKGLHVPAHPQLGKKPNIVFVGALIVYKGTDSEKKYWYKFSRIIYIHYNEGKNDAGQTVIEVGNLNGTSDDTSWDMNADTPPPKLKIPDWENLKGKASFYLRTGLYQGRYKSN